MFSQSPATRPPPDVKAAIKAHGAPERHKPLLAQIDAPEPPEAAQEPERAAEWMLHVSRALRYLVYAAATLLAAAVVSWLSGAWFGFMTISVWRGMGFQTSVAQAFPSQAADVSAMGGLASMIVFAGVVIAGAVVAVAIETRRKAD